MRFDFRAFAAANGISVDGKGSSDGWIQTHCPFCGDTNWHLGFGLSASTFNCWRCGRHSLYDTLLRFCFGSTDKARKAMAEYGTGTLPTPQKTAYNQSGAVPTPPGILPLGEVHKAFLRGRGLDPDRLVKDWGIKATGVSGTAWAWRVIAPITDQSGRVMAYTGRAVSKEKHPRWKTSAKGEIAGNPNEMLYGIQHVKDSVIIVEGVSDVWKMGPGAVATLGIKWRREQVPILGRVMRRFILYDNEPLAQQQAERLAEELAVYPGSTEILTGLDTDPGDLSEDAAWGIRHDLDL